MKNSGNIEKRFTNFLIKYADELKNNSKKISLNKKLKKEMISILPEISETYTNKMIKLLNPEK